MYLESRVQRLDELLEIRQRLQADGIEVVGPTDHTRSQSMHFFDPSGQLLAHMDKTRELKAGTIIGSGIVFNKQGSLFGSSIESGGVGYCCLAELRMYETIESGAPQTAFIEFGDSVWIEMLGAQGQSISGAIEEAVARCPQRA